MIRPTARCLISALVLLLLAAGAVWAQPLEDELRVVATEEGAAHVFHTKRVPLDYGFHVYRTVDGGAEEQLTEAAVRGASNGSAFRQMLDDGRYEWLRRRLDKEDATGVFFSLRADRATAVLMAYLADDVARGLGRLFVDEEAPVGREVTYRLAFVEPDGDPTGDELMKTVTLTPQRPAPPAELEARNDETTVTLNWSYATSSVDIPDQVVGFHVYRAIAGAEPQRVNEIAILRRVSEERQREQFPVVVLGRTETYYVTAVDVAGQESRRSEALRYEVRDNVAPNPIRGVTARVDDANRPVITWPVAPEPDVAGYHVYRARRTVDAGERITDALVPTLETVHVDSSLTRGGQFHYRVSAVDQAGNESDRSNAAMALVEDRTPPAAPAALDAEYDAENRRVLLRWQHDRRAPDFDTYVLVRRRLNTSEETTFSRMNVDDVRARSYADAGEAGEGFAEGAFYEFGVAAADEARTRSDTTFVTIQIPDHTPPDPPTSLSATNEDGLDIDLRWNPSRARDVSAYVVYRAAGDSASAEQARLDAPASFTEDQQVVVGRRYTYQVAAVDSLGNESARSEAVTLTMKEYDPPRAVRNVQAVVDEAGVQLAWGEIASEDLTAYRIFRAELATGVYEQIHETTPSTTRWRDPSGTLGHWYRVRAVDTSENVSQPSAPAEAVASTR